MTTLTQLSEHLTGSPLKPLVEAQLVKTAGGIIRQSGVSPERRTWASNVLNANGVLDSNRVMGLMLTNVTIFTTLAAGNLPPDGDIEYVVVNEVLPLIAPQ